MFKRSKNSTSNWNLEMLVLGREENRSTRRKTPGAKTRTNNKLNPHMTPSPGIEPGPHWWEASALTTAPSLLPAPGRFALSIPYPRQTSYLVFSPTPSPWVKQVAITDRGLKFYSRSSDRSSELLPKCYNSFNARVLLTN